MAPVPDGKDYKYHFEPKYSRNVGEYSYDPRACYFGSPAFTGSCPGGYTASSPYGGNYILAYRGPHYVPEACSYNEIEHAWECPSSKSPLWEGPASSFRFRAPDNWLVKAVEFDYSNNVDRSNFFISRYLRRRVTGNPAGEAVPATTGGDSGWIPRGNGSKYINMQPATGEFWLHFKISAKKKSDLHYGEWHRALISNIKLHLIKVDKTDKKNITVISNVFEPNRDNQPFNIKRVRFSNESASGDWSSWIPLDTLPADTKFGYGWPLANPTRTVWMEACTVYDLCAVFSDMIEYNPYGTVAGYIWNDLNNNDGTGKDPPSEPNYTASAVKVSYSCTGGGGETWTTNDGSETGTPTGTYTFANVPAGDCSVSIGPLALGWSNTTLASVGVTVSAGGTATANFGVWQNPKAWFQGCNGDIYGDGVSISVPYDCAVCCDRWFLGADPNTAGGVVISGNPTLSCSGRRSERGSPPGWSVKEQTIDWPTSLSFSSPAGASTISSADPVLQLGRSYVWNRSDVPSGTHEYLLGSPFYPGSGVAVLYVRGDFAINGKFKATQSPDTQGVVIVVDGKVTINRDTAGRDLEPLLLSEPGDESDIDAVIIASGTISVTGSNLKKRLVIKGMLYGRGGLSVTGEELEDNRYPRLKTIYNPLYFHSTNPLAEDSIIWREVAP